MTLVELCVTVAILALAMGFIMRGFFSMQKAATDSAIRSENLGEAQLIMDSVSKDLRTAGRLKPTESPFLEAKNTDVTFYANLNLVGGCPKKVRLFVDTDSTLKEQIWDPGATGSPPDNCVYPTNPSSSRSIGTYVVNPSTQPLFTYFYDNAGTQAAFAPTATPLSTANRLVVNGVGLNVMVNKRSNSTVASAALVNQVRLPNLDFNPVET